MSGKLKSNTYKRISSKNSNNLGNVYTLKLFISGATPHSVAAVKNITNICDEYLKGMCTLEIIDIYQKPQDAKLAQIIAVPTLIKLSPLPQRRLVGDMSDKIKVLNGLGNPDKLYD